MRRIVRLGLALLIVGLIAAAAYWAYGARLTARPVSAQAGGAGQIVQATKGNLSATITVVGQLDATQYQDLAFSRMSGSARLPQLLVKAGNTVKAGQALAALDPAPYQQAVDQANSDLQAAEKKLADLKTPITALQFAQADLAIAKAEYQRQQALSDLQTLKSPDLAKLQSAAADAQRALTQAQADLAALQHPDQAALDKMAKLRQAEADANAPYAALASKPAPNALDQDRLALARNAYLNALDARQTAETQAQADLLKAQSTVRKSQQALTEARDALAKAQAGGDALELAKADLAVRDAEVALATARDNRTQLDQGPDAVALATAQADLDRRRLALSDAQTDLAAATLTAPFDGTVLQAYVAQGDPVSASTRILALANLKSLQVVASIDETTIRQVAANQQVRITFDAFPGQSFRGQVLSVPMQGALQGGVMVYDVPISLTGADNLTLLVGMTANAEIQIGQVSDATLVPAMAVQRNGRSYEVLVPNTSTDPNDTQPKTRAVPVEIGLSNGLYTQITTGLNPGDQVVVPLSAGTQTNRQQGPPGDFGPPGSFAVPAVPAGGQPGGGIIIRPGGGGGGGR